MTKVLYLDTWEGIGSFFNNQRNQVKNVTSVNLYKKKSILRKIISFIGKKYYSPILYFAYGNWKHHINEYDIFIVDSGIASKYAIKFIKRKTNKRIIVWYWNIASDKHLNPNYCIENGCEAWTFDKNEAEKYHMFFNDTYYFENLNIIKNNIDIDVFYSGLAKENRIHILNDLKNIFNKNNISYEYHISSENSKDKHKNELNKIIPYEEILNKDQTARAILDLNVSNQTGLSLRPMEALFLEKKLITNNRNIKNYKFYNKENIFIIGEDNYSDLHEFIKSKYKKINKEILCYYNFENWLQRIINAKGEEDEN